MEARHTIDEFVLDLNFEEQADASQFEAGLHDWLREELLPPFEALFDRLSGPGEVLRLDTLEIDLGELDAGNLRQELCTRLLEKLQAALEEQLNHVRRHADAGETGNAANAGGMAGPGTARGTDLEEMLSFLATGRLPWQASADRTAAHELLLERVIQRDAPALIRAMAVAPARQVMLERLTRQYSGRHLENLLNKVWPSRHDFIAALLQRFSSSAGPDGTTMLPELWQAIWGSLFGADDDSEEKLAGRILHQFSQGGMAQRELLKAMRLAAAGEGGQANPVGKRLASWRDGKQESADAPDVVRQSYQALGNRQVTARELDLNLEQLRQLIALFIKHDAASGSGNEAAFIRAIEEHARQAGHGKVFYHRVLHSLANGELVDLAAIVRACLEPQRTPTQAAAKPAPDAPSRSIAQPAPLPSPPQEKHPAQEEQGQLRFRVAHCLMNGDAAQLESLWPILYRRYPALTRDALRHYGKFERIRRRLAFDYPEAMLRDFVELIEPGAEHIVAAMAGAASGFAPEAPAEWRRKLWDTAFSLLLQDAPSAFSSTAFAGLMLGRLPREESDPARWAAIQDSSMPAALQLALWRNSADLARNGAVNEHSLLLLARLKQAWARTVATAVVGDTFLSAFDLLFERHAAVLPAFLESLRSEDFVAGMTQLGAERLRRLLSARQALSPASNVPHDVTAAVGLDDFLEQLERESTQSGVPAEYFRQRLQTLLQPAAVVGGSLDGPTRDPVLETRLATGGNAAIDKLRHMAQDGQSHDAQAWFETMLAVAAVPAESLALVGPEILQKAVERFLEHVAQADAGNRRLFIDTVMQRADHMQDSRSQAHFLATVLLRLQSGAAIDFDELAGQFNAGPARQKTERTSLADLRLEIAGKLASSIADEARRRAFLHAAEHHAQLAGHRHRFYALLSAAISSGEAVDLEHLVRLASDGKTGKEIAANIDTHPVQDEDPGEESARNIVLAEIAGRPASETTRGAFQDSIEEHARFAGDKRRFYELVHAALSQGGYVDLAVLALKAGPSLATTAPAAPGNGWQFAAEGEGGSVERGSMAAARDAVLAQIAKHAGNGERRASFIHAVEHHAQLAGNRERYYRLVHEALYKGDAVDLELLAAQSATAVATDVGEPAVSPQSTGHRQALHGASAAAPAAADGHAALLQEMRRQGMPEDRQADFLAAFALHAAKAGGRPRFTELVYEAMAAGQAIDLEQCVELAGAEPSTPASSGHELKQESKQVSEQISEQEAEQKAGQKAEQKAPVESITRLLEQGEHARVRTLFEASLQQFVPSGAAAERLRQWFSDGKTAAGLLEVIAPDMLARSFSLLLGSAFIEADRLALSIVDAVAFVSGRMPEKLVLQIRQRAIVEYFFLQQKNFEQQGFIEAVTVFAVDEAGLPDDVLLRELLAIRLVPPTKAPGATLPADAGLTSSSAPASRDMEENLSNIDVHIENAGLVLAWPYLPQLFSMLKLMERNVFVDAMAAQRAVHLLQFLVTGESRTPEYALVLNKQLCGVATGVPIIAGIDITDHERETIEGLIQGMISHWKILGNTSIQGFRESFLQRQGWLTLQEDIWHLRVQTRAYDMLLDQLPWGISMVKHAWMPRAIHVKWR